MPGTDPPGPALLVGSLILAMTLRILPLPEPWVALNPDWIALVLIYWVIAFPERVGLGTAWITGLFADVLTGRMLGQHALAYVVLAYLGLRGYRRLRFYALPQQCFWIGLMLLLVQLLVHWTQKFRPATGAGDLHWAPAFTGAALWPLLYWLMRRIRRAAEPT